MVMQNFGAKNKEHYGMLWYFLEWSISEGYSRRVQEKKENCINIYVNCIRCTPVIYMRGAQYEAAPKRKYY